jgi:excisionase family DNA binding protein
MQINNQNVDTQSLLNQRLFELNPIQFIQLMADNLPNILKENNKSAEDEFLTMEDVSKLLRVSIATLHGLTSKRKLTFYQPNKANLFKKSDVLAYIEQFKKPSKESINLEAHEFLLDKDQTKTNRVSRRHSSFTKNNAI